jgi:hypothetical protein
MPSPSHFFSCMLSCLMSNCNWIFQPIHSNGFAWRPT